MLVAKQHKKLVLNLKNIDRVTTVIPTAKPFDFKGHTLVAVPHRTDEVRVLRNLGFDAPAPVSYYYDWPGVYTPFAHQKHMVEFMSTNPRCFNLGDMGTGKTLSVLWAYDWLRSVGELRRALIITPLSTLERTWGDEIFKHFSHLSFGVLHGTPERRLKVLAQEHDIYLVNHDGIKGKALFNALMKREDIDLVVIDEVAAFRNPGTDKWKALRKLIENKSWVWGLTGTPTPNEPTDAWGQCKLIVPEKVPRYRGQFTDMVMKKVSQFKWVPKADANDTVHSVMQPAIRYARKDCIDLPPTTYQTYEVELGPDQKRVYEDMLKKLKAEWEGGQLTAANEAVKMNKLLQIACGAAYDKHGNTVIIPAKQRLEVLHEIIEGAGAKVIVFVPIVAAVEAVAEVLAKRYEVGVIHGGTPKGERDRIFGAFQKTEEPRIIVAQPAAMSHGLTLTRANTIVWFAPITSNEVYEQANARIVRPGQKSNTLIAHIEGSDVERRMYDRLRKRGTSQGILLDMFQDKG